MKHKADTLFDAEEDYYEVEAGLQPSAYNPLVETSVEGQVLNGPYESLYDTSGGEGNYGGLTFPPIGGQ